MHLKYGQIKLYAKTRIDRVIRYVYAKIYEELNSVISRELISEKKEKVPFNIKAIQTDNGLECKKHFDEYVEDKKIIHYFNYPQKPKSDVYIERFNRTIQEFFNNI